MHFLRLDYRTNQVTVYAYFMVKVFIHKVYTKTKIAKRFYIQKARYFSKSKTIPVTYLYAKSKTLYITQFFMKILKLAFL